MMRDWLKAALIWCGEAALSVGAGLTAIAKRMVANDLNRRSERQRSDGK